MYMRDTALFAIPLGCVPSVRCRLAMLYRQGYCCRRRRRQPPDKFI